MLITDLKTTTDGLVAIVRAYVNSPPGTPAEPGKLGIQTYLAQAQSFFAKAAEVQGKAPM
jgi:hypothetical protein